MSAAVDTRDVVPSTIEPRHSVTLRLSRPFPRRFGDRDHTIAAPCCSFFWRCRSAFASSNGWRAASRALFPAWRRFFRGPVLLAELHIQRGAKPLPRLGRALPRGLELLFRPRSRRRRLRLSGFKLALCEPFPSRTTSSSRASRTAASASESFSVAELNHWKFYRQACGRNPTAAHGLPSPSKAASASSALRDMTSTPFFAWPSCSSSNCSRMNSWPFLESRPAPSSSRPRPSARLRLLCFAPSVSSAAPLLASVRLAATPPQRLRSVRSALACISRLF